MFMISQNLKVDSIHIFFTLMFENIAGQELTFDEYDLDYE